MRSANWPNLSHYVQCTDQPDKSHGCCQSWQQVASSCLRQGPKLYSSLEYSSTFHWNGKTLAPALAMCTLHSTSGAGCILHAVPNSQKSTSHSYPPQLDPLLIWFERQQQVLRKCTSHS